MLFQASNDLEVGVKPETIIASIIWDYERGIKY
jgi:hypothetical protein